MKLHFMPICCCCSFSSYWWNHIDPVCSLFLFFWFVFWCGRILLLTSVVFFYQAKSILWKPEVHFFQVPCWSKYSFGLFLARTGRFLVSHVQFLDLIVDFWLAWRIVLVFGEGQEDWCHFSDSYFPHVLLWKFDLPSFLDSMNLFCHFLVLSRFCLFQKLYLLSKKAHFHHNYYSFACEQHWMSKCIFSASTGVCCGPIGWECGWN